MRRSPAQFHHQTDACYVGVTFRLVNDQIVWAPAIGGAFVLTTRGGDFALHIGQDVSIGYSNHTDAAVSLYLQETFTFLLLTAEAAVALVPPGKTKKT